MRVILVLLAILMVTAAPTAAFQCQLSKNHAGVFDPCEETTFHLANSFQHIGVTAVLLPLLESLSLFILLYANYRTHWHSPQTITLTPLIPPPRRV